MYAPPAPLSFAGTRRCHVALFEHDGFDKGRWAKNLRHELSRLPIIPGWQPRVRLWHGTWQQWIQFEPEGFRGPFFWSGKAAVLSSSAALYAGYYVERGLPPGEDQPELIMGPGWHWHGFRRALCEEPILNHLSAIVARLPRTRRCIWVSNPASGRGRAYPFKTQSTAVKVRAYVDSIPSDKWVDVIIGVQYSKDECLGLQNQIVEEIIEPLKEGHELYTLVCSSQP